MHISIIIPVYNVERYIGKCLQSVMAQTYTDGVECLLVDDCSPDGSIAVAEKLIDGYTGGIAFRILRRKANGGLSAARNTGIKAAQGSYLYFLDSDDWITADCLQRLMEVARKHPKAQIVHAGLKATCGGFAYLSLAKKHLRPYTESHVYAKRQMLWAHYPPMAQSKLISREWLLAHGLFFKEGRLHEDDHWNFFAAKHIGRYAVCPHDTYIYNVREGSITTAPGERNLRSILCSIDDYMDNVDDDSRSSQLVCIFRTIYCTYLRCDEPWRGRFRAKFSELGRQCRPLGRMAIGIVAHSPYAWHDNALFRMLCSKVVPRMLCL